MSGHTPGPWVAHMHEGCANPFVTRANSIHGWICEAGPHPIDNRAEREANARLIAMAPGMLADFEKIATENPPAGVTFKQWVRTMADKHRNAA